ncbi:DUF2567 domain-containing protein [Actinomycetospora sp. TBRC 11914]|uniref:DUF2567 domain-containing protein n=1 Tax=Actinomycetospora sp. TBRC 11914 TaxID=2729387 RepID=UPI00145E9996|nr:DUF2567 domain-containing protein [Actinomycetospora sp. TBRC 11914]NMO93276.1 DUF2567 domain-containing protein [Actinomycetospora sp. TBRC 11914]
MTVGAEQFPADEFVAETPDGVLTRRELVGDLRPALRIVVAVLVGGLLLGLLWALVAPGQATVTTATGASAQLAAESDHVFDATAVFFLLVTAYGVVVGALAWRIRTRRGPVVLVGVAVASTAAAWVAARVGTWLAGPLTDRQAIGVLLDRAEVSASGTGGPPIPATLVTLPAEIGSWWTVLGAGIGAVLAYLLCAITVGADDLGREP